MHSIDTRCVIHLTSLVWFYFLDIVAWQCASYALIYSFLYALMHGKYTQKQILLITYNEKPRKKRDVGGQQGLQS